MNALSRPARREEGQPSLEEVAEILRRVYEKLSKQADQLGDCGAPVQFLAEEILQLTNLDASLSAQGIPPAYCV